MIFSAPSSDRPFTIMIDGGCPICTREAATLRRLDRGRNLLRIVDITAPDFNPGQYGRTMDQLMGAIHGVLPSGEILTGMEVFRHVYTLLGWGWLWAPTGWPILRPIFDRFYAWFARNRLRFTLRHGWRGLFHPVRAAGCEGDRCRLQHSSQEIERASTRGAASPTQRRASSGHTR